MSLYSTSRINGFNSNNYIQVKPNKMIRAELLRKDTAQQKNPQYIRTKPNTIVRTKSVKPITVPVQPAINVSAESDKASPVTVSTKIDKVPSVTSPTQLIRANNSKVPARQTRSLSIVRSPIGNGSNHLRSRSTIFRSRANPNKYTRSDIEKTKIKKVDSSSRQAAPPFKTKLINQYCKYFHKCGRCKDGGKCAYKHDPDRVAVCKSWLSGDRCKMGDKCLLQHKESPHVVPHCRHFNHGLCINPKCHYTHVHVNSKAPYCKYFGKDKYCPNGEECKLKHEWRLANFDEDEAEQTNASSSDSNELGKRKREDDLKRKIRIRQPGEEIDPFKARFDYISLDDYHTDPK